MLTGGFQHVTVNMAFVEPNIFILLSYYVFCLGCRFKFKQLSFVLIMQGYVGKEVKQVGDWLII